jgi:hypothetical protein
MIPLSKGAKPAVLVTNESTWTREYANHVAGVPGTPAAAATRYRHPEIKSSIRNEAHDKCVYCESMVDHVYPGDCEHIAPKALFPELVVDWNNLAYVCSVCNHEKSNYWNPAEPLLNPFTEDPSHLLDWAGPFCTPRNAERRAVQTIAVLDLDRAPLVVQRAEAIKYADKLIELWEREPPGPAKDAMDFEIRRTFRSDKPYSAAVRAFVSWKTSSAIP